MDREHTPVKPYDVFISYSSDDASAVEELACKLRLQGLRPFLDRWIVVPGRVWMDGLDAALGQSRTCAVILGPNRSAPWRKNEAQMALISEQSRELEAVIPVLLPEAKLSDFDDVPGFLRLRRWVEFRKGLDDGQALHELVCGIQGRMPNPTPEPVPRGSDVSPYPGFEPFTSAHFGFFFGRKLMVERMMELLRRGSRFLAVVGHPGSGKSSVVRAGLLPLLVQGVLPERPAGVVFDLPPSFHPIDHLVGQLAAKLAPGSSPKERRRIRDRLLQDRRTLHLELQRRFKGRNPATTAFFLIDQLEEVVLADSAKERRAFVDTLLYASGISWGHAVALITVRSDYQVVLQEFPDLVDQITANTITAPPLEEAELREAIEEPARIAGASLDSGLVDRILSDLQSQATPLPLLQDTLAELWQCRSNGCLTHDSYDNIGGLHGGFTRWAESIYSDLSDRQQAIARRIFVRLIQGAGHRSRSGETIGWGELVDDLGDEADVDYVVDRFSTRGILAVMSNNGHTEKYVILSQEGLRLWLKGWVEQLNPSAREHSWLQASTQRWEANERDSHHLMQGPELIEMERWSRDHLSELSEAQREFLAASRSRTFTATRQVEISVRYACIRRRSEEER